MAGLVSSVMVSPILVSATFLMLAMMKPTSPACRSIDLHRLGREHAESFRVEGGSVPHETDSLALAQACLETRGPAR